MVTRRKWNPQTNRFEVEGGDILGGAFNNPNAPMTSGTTTTTAPARPKVPQGPVAPKQPAKGGRGKSMGATAEGFNVSEVERAIQRAVAQDSPSPQNGQQPLDINKLFEQLTANSSAALAAQKAAQAAALAAAKGRAAYGGGMRAATQQEDAGTEAQNLYNQMAADEYARMTGDITARYNPQFEALNKYYTGAETGAVNAINAASQQAMQDLAAPTAYQNLQSALLSAPSQALDLGQYGATGELASKQAATDAETAKFVSDLLNRGYQQTQAVNQDYMTSLKNAMAGTQQQATGQLANTIAALRAQDIGGLRSAQQTETANAAAVRDQLLRAGIEALMSGKQTAATTRASTEASYGQYKPKPKKKPTPKKPSA